MTDSSAQSDRMSVVVCTRNRAGSIGETLESLGRQDYPGYEVLVVDQSTGEETRREVARLAQTMPQLRYMHLDKPGLSRAYNCGVQSTTGSILAFTDDDCVAPPSWLSSIAEAFLSNPGVGLLYGQVLLPESLRMRENVKGVTPGLPIARRRVLSRVQGFEVFGMGANFAARRALFDQIGGFDEVLGGGGPLQSTQDFDFAYRVFKGGEAILLEPDVAVYHHGFRSHSDWPATVRSYGIGVGGFYFKHVRLGDLYAARLLATHFGLESARLVKRICTRSRAGIQWTYVRHVVAGIVRSCRFKIDRDARVYLNGPAA